MGMSVPFLPRGPMSPVALMRQVMGDSFFYILYFQEPGVADAELGRAPGETMKRMLAGLTTPPAGEEVDLMSLSANDRRAFVERTRAVDELPTWLKIGRASCRERVGQYLVIWVGACTLTKQNRKYK